MAMALRLPAYVRPLVAMMWVLALFSATQDICTDGIYITSLAKNRQAAWIVRRSPKTTRRPARTSSLT
jgi:PAT family beta-lactamase induction signal transducer AmpG